MTDKEFKEILAFKLGELTYTRDRTYEWMEKNKLSTQIDAIYVLLNEGEEKYEKLTRPNWYSKWRY